MVIHVAQPNFSRTYHSHDRDGPISYNNGIDGAYSLDTNINNKFKDPSQLNMESLYELLGENGGDVNRFYNLNEYSRNAHESDFRRCLRRSDATKKLATGSENDCKHGFIYQCSKGFQMNHSVEERHAVNVAANALAILQEKQVNFNSTQSVAMEDINENWPSLSWKSSGKMDLRFDDDETATRQLLDGSYKFFSSTENVARTGRKQLDPLLCGFNRDDSAMSIGTTVSGFSEIDGSKRSIGSFDPSFNSRDQNCSLLNTCASPTVRPESPMFIECPSSSELHARGFEHITNIYNKSNVNTADFPCTVVHPYQKNIFSDNVSATQAQPKVSFASSCVDRNYSTTCYSYESPGSRAFADKIDRINRHLNMTSLNCPSSDDHQPGHLSQGFSKNMVTSSSNLKVQDQITFPTVNPILNSYGTTMIEQWNSGENDMQNVAFEQQSTFLNPTNISYVDDGMSKSLISNDASPEREDPSSVLDRGRDSHFEIDETLWITIPRNAICNAERCQYRNNATLVSHKKHYHARCHHTHQTGEKQGMPFHHHQLEKIKKHQRFHQSRSQKNVPGRTPSPAHCGSSEHGKIPSNFESPISLDTARKVLESDAPWELNETERLKMLAEAPGGGGWEDIANALGTGRTEEACKAKWLEIRSMKSQDAKTGVGSWTQEEDERLMSLVKSLGPKWAQICNHMPGRVGKQCRERYLNHLDPSLKKTPWTEEEDRLLIELHKKLNNSWADIARQIKGRCDNDVKNRWNRIQRRSVGKTSSTTPIRKTFTFPNAMKITGSIWPSSKSSSNNFFTSKETRGSMP